MENSRLKKLLVEAELDKAMLKKIAEGLAGGCDGVVTAVQRRAASGHLMAAFGVPTSGLPRVGHLAVQPAPSDRPPRAADDILRERLRDLAFGRPWFGYRQLCFLLGAKGHLVNQKRVARLWREEGLQARGNTAKRRRVGTSTAPEASAGRGATDHE